MVGDPLKSESDQARGYVVSDSAFCHGRSCSLEIFKGPLISHLSFPYSSIQFNHRSSIHTIIIHQNKYQFFRHGSLQTRTPDRGRNMGLRQIRQQVRPSHSSPFLLIFNQTNIIQLEIKINTAQIATMI